MQELIKALIKAKAEFNSIQKDGTNPHFKKKYATDNRPLAEFILCYDKKFCFNASDKR